MPRARWLGARAPRMLSATLWLVAVLAATALTIRLVPSGAHSGSSGLWSWLGRAADAQPLVSSLALFGVFATVGAYWRRHFDKNERGASGPVSPVRAAVSLIILGIALFGVRSRLVEISRVSGASMEPTLRSGDHLVVNKLAYGLRLPFFRRTLAAKPPRRGDLIVFPNPDRAQGPSQPASIVKRVVGLPGDEVTYAQGSPIINGWPVPSCDVGPFLIAEGARVVRGRLAVEVLDDRAYLTLRAPLDDRRLPPFTVPPGQVFVLGDDRPVSRDSRDWNDGRGGGVAIDGIEGRVSRLAAAFTDEGWPGLRQLVAGLRPELRALNVDLSQLKQRIKSCLAHKPPSSSPPSRSPLSGGRTPDPDR